MVCSACGYENQVGHRFCGMCGMPLPHRPLTAPGANSTLDLTRVPFENGSGSQHSATGRTGVLTEMPNSGDSAVAVNSDGNTSAQTTVDVRATSDEALAAEPLAISSQEPPPTELVPDLPLDEYIKTFHYEPPRDPIEITMRGDASVQELDVPRSEAPTSEVSSVAADAIATSITATDGATPAAGVTDVPGASTVATGTSISATVAADATPTSTTTPEQIAISETTTAAEADVDSRLGLEPEGAVEARIERPRFLDINEPRSETKPASGTSTVVGPSFLGLSDVPQVAEEPSVVAAEAAEPARGRGRLWLAAAVVLIFAALGGMEWRAQRNQTGNGPVEIIKKKIRDWKHQNPSQGSSESAAPASSSDSSAKPEMQVQDQSKPAPQDQATAASGPATSIANSTSAATTPETNAATPALTASAKTPTGSQVPAVGQGPPAPLKPTPAPRDTQAAAGENAAVNQTPEGASKPASSQEALPTAVEKPKATPPATDNQEAPVKQATLGADEMAKAKNASDSAAAAAWLWKATAKGNSDAPVQLADMYVKGDGVPRSCEQAVVLLKTAAEKENARARNRLAAMYATGNCVSRNRVEAYRWVSSALATNPNSQWAQQNRDLLWQQMTPEERAAAGKYRYSK